MAEIENLFESEYLGNTAGEWLLAGGVMLLVFIALLLLRRLVRAHYKRLLATPTAELMEAPLQVASHTTVWFVLIAAVFAGLHTLELPPKPTRLAVTVFTIAAFWQVGVWLTTGVLASLDRKRARTLAVDRAAASSLGIIGFIARTTIWSFVLLLTLDNLGIEIKPLLAGLGIGGIAVALAAQNILGDLFASLSIALDRPFVVGDALAVDDFSGTVEYIGVKSTRLRSITGEQIIMSNADILKSRVRNWGRMRERRVVMALNVTYDTPPDTLRTIPIAVRDVVTAQPNTRFDRCHFMAYAESSLQFELVFVVTSADYGVYADVQQAVNLAILERFATLGVKFALPTRRMVTE